MSISRDLERKSHKCYLLPASLEANASSLAASVGAGVFPRGGKVKTVLLILALAALLLSFFVEDAAEAPVAAGLGAGGVGYFYLLACVGRGCEENGYKNVPGVASTAAGSLWMDWDLEGPAEGDLQEGDLQEGDLGDLTESNESWRCCLKISKRKKPDMVEGMWLVVFGRGLVVFGGGLMLLGGSLVVMKD